MAAHAHFHDDFSGTPKENLLWQIDSYRIGLDRAGDFRGFARLDRQEAVGSDGMGLGLLPSLSCVGRLIGNR